MFDIGDFKQYGSFVVVLIAIVFIAVSGLFFGVLHYTLETTETAFQSSDCVIENNSLVDSCQELWEISFYPFLALRSILVWFSILSIFGMSLGILLIGYQSGKSPVLLGLLVLFLVGLTYMAIEVSNIYRTLLENEIFRTMMVDFVAYNKIMLGFPWFVFVLGLFSFMLSIANYQRTKVNTPQDELDY
jgi:hypothetical protein